MPDAEDLWGGSFQPTNAESAPVTLLKKQASLLTSKTGGRVYGTVKEDVSRDGTVWVSLYARVPSLGDYEHKLISIAHPVSAGDAQFPFPLTAVDTRLADKVLIENMARFREWLGKTLSSGEVRSIISNLMKYGAQATASASIA
jgi:hypothetical protein